MNMSFGDWVSIMPRPIGPLLAYLTNQTPEPLQMDSHHWSDTLFLGWYEWVMTLHVQCQAWYGSGFFGFITKITAWASSQICMIALGKQSCETLQNGLTFLVACVVVVCVLYGIDWMLRPFVFLGARMYRLYRALRGVPDEITVSTLGDCDWRGPATNTPADNDFFRDKIRARSTVNRKPNHVVIEVNGSFARCSRSGSRIRQINRFGQPFEVHEVVSATTNALRTGNVNCIFCLS